MGIVAGYVFVGPRTMSEREQRAAVIAAGADPDRVWTDKSPSRDSRSNMVDRGLTSGDTVIVAVASAIGAGGNTRDRVRILRGLADAGIRVQVGAGPAVLYDDQEKIEAYLSTALTESRKASGRALGKSAKGRPRKAALTAEQRTAIGALWYDKNVPIETVLATASKLLGVEVKRHDLRNWFGSARRDPDAK